LTDGNLEIAQLGAKVLRQTAACVADVHRPDIQRIIKDMRSALSATEGVGLAAPQIGMSQRIIIVASRPTKRYPSAPIMQATVMVNPVFQALSETKVKDWEGCLSIPGIRALVPRYTDIMIQYTDQYGTAVALQVQDFVARVFQHE
jgi:peptide deformylase